MNICYINPTKVLRRPIIEIANKLANKGHKISIIYPHDKKNPIKDFHFQNLTKNNNIILYPINSFYIPTLRYSLPNPLQLIKITKNALKKNDILHIWEYYYPYSIAPLLFKKSKAKIILTTDGYVGYSYKPGLLLTILFRIYTNLFGRIIFNKPDKLTTYGNNLKKYALKAKVPIENLLVIPTGIDLTKFKPENNNLKEKLDISRDTTVILFIGMLTERKGIPIVIRISKNLYKKHNLKTLIVGTGPFEKKYKKLAGKTDCITFLGQRKDIPELLNMSDILLLPSMGEGLPGVVMEASACGKPSIATYEGATPDIINEKTGILIKPYDTKGYEKALEKLIVNKKLRENMGKNALKHIKKFSWDKIIIKYENLYSELLK